MKLEELASKYIQSTDKVFNEMKIRQGSIFIEGENIKSVIENAKRYWEDAKHYRDKRKFETSLTSVAYCEGLLDALRLLGAVEFSWR
jgi:FAD synthetase